MICRSLLTISLALCTLVPALADEPVRISGRYPHLTMYNTVRGGECGIGAVVPWADRLWAITYSPHKPHGSGDKLFEIDNDLNLVTRPESVGGTPANRLIHRESNQLIIGPYFIDAERNVRVVTPKEMPGRHTATARHLTDPANKVYFFDMEGKLYEVDVNTLEVTTLFEKPIPGWHGKGGYTGQGRLVLANNGEEPAGRNDASLFEVGDVAKTPEEAGALGEWDGKEWRLVERRQFTEVTGPGGIYGAPSDESPLWSIGWDKRSLILKLCDNDRWYTFRMPLADRSYFAKHGWYTEWPRIREVVPAQGDQPARLLMNLHGGWWDFPKTFSAANTAGLRPLGSYLKITADFAPWRDEIVFACDDAAIIGNPLVGQSHSNLWFTNWEDLQRKGRPTGWGGVWLKDDVEAGAPSVPYLFAGYDKRMVHLAHNSPHEVNFKIEIDTDGKGNWTEYKQVSVPARGYVHHVFPDDVPGEWVRLTTDKAAAKATAYFHYGTSAGVETKPEMFASLADVDENAPRSGGIMRARGGDLGSLHWLATRVDEAGNAAEAEYYEVGPDLKLQHFPDRKKEREYLEEHGALGEPDFTIDTASVVLTDSQGRRYRLPKSSAGYDKAWPEGAYRGIREVVTERNLLNAHGTFYMLPRANSTGIAGIKPVCTHDKQITDFCSWRGLLVLAGNRTDADSSAGHYLKSEDGRVGLWLGDIDDLWKLGKPRGQGGPWHQTAVTADEPSDPYLMTGYDKKRVELSHNADQPVNVTIEVDIACDGSWLPYATLSVPAGEKLTHAFPAGFAAAWVRVKADRDCEATAHFVYE